MKVISFNARPRSMIHKQTYCGPQMIDMAVYCIQEVQLKETTTCIVMKNMKKKNHLQ